MKNMKLFAILTIAVFLASALPLSHAISGSSVTGRITSQASAIGSSGGEAVSVAIPEIINAEIEIQESEFEVEVTEEELVGEGEFFAYYWVRETSASEEKFEKIISIKGTYGNGEFSGTDNERTSISGEYNKGHLSGVYGEKEFEGKYRKGKFILHFSNGEKIKGRYILNPKDTEKQVAKVFDFDTSKDIYTPEEKIEFSGKLATNFVSEDDEIEVSIKIYQHREHPLKMEDIREIEVRVDQCTSALQATSATAGDSVVCKFSASTEPLKRGFYTAIAKPKVSDAEILVSSIIRFSVLGEQTGEATVRVKAYDVETSEVVAATTIILEPRNPIRPITPGTTELVVATLQANGEATVSLKPGVYTFLTYAIGYQLYKEGKIIIDGNKEYNLYAPLSKGEGIAETRPTIIIKEIKSGKETIEIKTETETEVEVDDEIPQAKPLKKIVVIKPSEEEAGSRFVLEHEGMLATTKAEIEIEDDRLYIKESGSKKQIKVLPKTASEIVKARAGEIKNIKLEIKGSVPVYEVEGEQSLSLFGFIPVKATVFVEVDAETGNIQKVEGPWWSIFAIAKPVAR